MWQKTAAFDAVFGVVPTMSAAYTSATCLTGVYLVACTLYMGVYLIGVHLPHGRVSYSVHLINVHPLIGVYLVLILLLVIGESTIVLLSASVSYSYA